MSRRTRSAYRRRDDFIVAIERVLAAHGVDDYSYRTRGNSHRSVVIRLGQRQRFVSFPSTSRNRLGPWNTAADVKRAIREMRGEM